MKSLSARTAISAVSAKINSAGFIDSGDTSRRPVLSFMDAVFRGIGQVMLQNNSYSGLIFLTGIFYNSIILGFAALLGAIVSTATAILLGADRSRICDGLFGFNGALVAIALLYFFSANTLIILYVVLAAACTTVVMAALLNFLKTWNIPALTAPFVLTTLLFLLAHASFGQLHSTGALPRAVLPEAASIDGTVITSTLVEGMLSGIAQVFLQGGAVTGLFFVAGLLISSRVACGVAVLGSLVGALVAWGMGASEPEIRSGLFGFNCALTAIVFGSGVFVASFASAAYGALAVATTTVVFAAMSAALEPLGMPALTSPFVLVTWVFLLASPHFLRVPSCRAGSS